LAQGPVTQIEIIRSLALVCLGDQQDVFRRHFACSLGTLRG